jgi:hypothetical protein
MDLRLVGVNGAVSDAGCRGGGCIFMSIQVDVGKVLFTMTQFVVYIYYNHNYVFPG